MYQVSNEHLCLNIIKYNGYSFFILLLLLILLILQIILLSVPSFIIEMAPALFWCSNRAICLHCAFMARQNVQVG